ncbi:MAG: LemA family protein [Desulfobacterales bacterium]|nr:LemA family protein [Desulfobacterales bacterium]
MKAAWSEVDEPVPAPRRPDARTSSPPSRARPSFEQETLTEVVEARARRPRSRPRRRLLNNPEAFQQVPGRRRASCPARCRGCWWWSRSTRTSRPTRASRTCASQLEGTENRITVARNRYIKAVKKYNTELRTIPGRWWAALLYSDAKVRETFTVPEAAKQVPQVKFLIDCRNDGRLSNRVAASCGLLRDSSKAPFSLPGERTRDEGGRAFRPSLQPRHAPHPNPLPRGERVTGATSTCTCTVDRSRPLPGWSRVRQRRPAIPRPHRPRGRRGRPALAAGRDRAHRPARRTRACHHQPGGCAHAQVARRLRHCRLRLPGSAATGRSARRARTTASF